MFDYWSLGMLPVRWQEVAEDKLVKSQFGPLFKDVPPLIQNTSSGIVLRVPGPECLRTCTSSHDWVYLSRPGL